MPITVVQTGYGVWMMTIGLNVTARRNKKGFIRRVIQRTLIITMARIGGLNICAAS